ncbi:MAG: succinate-semialdehyde dehydrogenase/glutarate-semialdehyde dehydrogenase [Saprospiraceae bacterium]|jgi:succinate-semialdehyde dehydrogenase/glutarate-semialdehyde dehydrogenase
MVREMGKTITEAIGEIEKCAWVCRYYAENSEGFLAKEIIKIEAEKSYATFQPIGAILAIMPWNYPFWQVFRFAAPALMAGNVGLLKHASNVLGCGDATEEIFLDAGFPKGAFTHLKVSSNDIEKILENPIIKAVTLTESEAAGSSVASIAGRNIKKTVLELGGSDAYLILEDADIDKAAEICTNGRLMNVGQSCIGAKRFIVLEEVYDQFLKAFKKENEGCKNG